MDQQSGRRPQASDVTSLPPRPGLRDLGRQVAGELGPPREPSRTGSSGADTDRLGHRELEPATGASEAGSVGCRKAEFCGPCPTRLAPSERARPLRSEDVTPAHANLSAAESQGQGPRSLQNHELRSRSLDQLTAGSVPESVLRSWDSDGLATPHLPRVARERRRPRQRQCQAGFGARLPQPARGHRAVGSAPTIQPAALHVRGESTPACLEALGRQTRPRTALRRQPGGAQRRCPGDHALVQLRWSGEVPRGESASFPVSRAGTLSVAVGRRAVRPTQALNRSCLPFC